MPQFPWMTNGFNSSTHLADRFGDKGVSKCCCGCYSGDCTPAQGSEGRETNGERGRGRERGSQRRRESQRARESVLVWGWGWGSSLISGSGTGDLGQLPSWPVSQPFADRVPDSVTVDILCSWARSTGSVNSFKNSRCLWSVCFPCFPLLLGWKIPACPK